MRDRVVVFLFLGLTCSLVIAQTAVTLLPVPHIQFLDSTGKPLSSGKVFTYQAGTTTPLATYTDSTGTTQNANPVILNSGGFGDIWLQAGQSYKILVQDSSGVQQWVRDLNNYYRHTSPLWECDFEHTGFEWIDSHDAENSTISFVRKGNRTRKIVLVVCNFTPVPRLQHRVGVPRGGYWREVLNSDASVYGGSGVGNMGGVQGDQTHAQGRWNSVVITLPPLSVLFFESEG